MEEHTKKINETNETNGNDETVANIADENETQTPEQLRLLEKIKNAIENLEKKEHIELLKIFKKSQKIALNEYQGKTSINLSYLEKKFVDEIIIYLQSIGYSL
jgi:tRNA (Thr-GGU) A37 N-methylase